MVLYERCPPIIPPIRPHRPHSLSQAGPLAEPGQAEGGGRWELRGWGAVERANRMMVVYGIVLQGARLCAIM